MYVWGRNNNHLFKHNHKKTYSLPQKLPINRTVSKCAPGYDYILMLYSQPGPLACYYQNAIYQIKNFKNVVDIATTDNMIVVVTDEGQAWIMEFNADKIIAEGLTPGKINLKEKVKSVCMNYGDIFLVCQSNNIYHLTRNQWYETKTYSDPILIQGLDGKIIKTIAPGLHQNYFVTTDGKLYKSQKNMPTQVIACEMNQKFISVAAADYFAGIGQNGRLYIWGKYFDQTYQKPTQFGKIAQPFKNVCLSSQNGFAITQSGQAWIWGKNANGELGISDYEPRMKPFPLITMQKQKIKQIYIGEGYTICLNELIQMNKKPKIYAVQSMTVNHMQISRSRNEMSPNFTNINLDNSYNQKQQTQITLQPIKTTQALRQINPQKMQHQKKKSQQKTPRKSGRLVKSPNNISGQSKSPVSKGRKSPNINHIHIRQKSHSNLKAKKQLTQKQNKQSILHITPQKNIELIRYIQNIQQQNVKLKKMVQIKDNIIDDITSKIRLLEDAIDEHQRNLTSRDNMMEEYQRREKQYRIHIDELEKSIQNLIKGKNSQNNSEEHFKEMYRTMKFQLNKEKEYFFNKMKEYEDNLKQERINFKEKIKNLEEQIFTYRSNSHRDQKELKNIDISDIFKSKCEEAKNSKATYKQQPSKEQNISKMQLMISRIQQSKVRIGKSASKLIEMLEQ